MHAAKPSSGVIRFEGFRLDIQAAELRDSTGRTIHLPEQPFQILSMLLAQPGGVVTREDIRQRLWPSGTVVEFEHSISAAMNRLRAALGDSAENPRFIETARRGYRFKAPVECEELQATAEHQLSERRRNAWWLFALLAVIGVGAVLAIGFGWHKWQGRRSQSQLTEQQLTSNAPEDYVVSSAISPDGRYFAYVDQSGLFARSLDSGETRPIFLPADLPATQVSSILWFPDGGKLLLTRWTSEGFSLWVIPVLGKAPPQLLREDAADAAMSPDGESIAFWSGPQYQPQDLWVSGINGETPHKIAAAVPMDLPTPLSWSPDGKWIAYFNLNSSKSRAAGLTIEARPASGGPSKLLVSNADLAKRLALDDNCLYWSPDGRLIFEVADLSALPQMYRYGLWQVVVNSDGLRQSRPPQQLTVLHNFLYESLTASLNGKKLAVLESRIHQDVYLTELHDGELKAPHRFTLDNRDSFPELWTHDSQSILFVSNRNGRNELFKQGLNDSVPQKMESNTTEEIGFGNAFTADGKWLLFWQGPPRSSRPPPQLPIRLMRQEIGGGAPEQLVEMPYGEGVNANLRCPLKTGSCVLQLLGEENGDSLLFYAIDPIHGKGGLLGSIQIPDLRFVGWSLSPDGSEISVVGHKDQIDILNLPTRSWRAINVQPGWGDFQSVAWDAHGKGFFLTTVLPQSFNLIYVSLNGNVQRLLSNAHRQWFYQPLPSPDGRYLAFQAQTWDSNVWLLKNF